MTTQNPLQHLADFGQSVWNDNLSRDLIRSGDLQRLIDEDGIVGITSNPTIFDNAISDSNDYDDQMRDLVAAGRSPDEIQDALMVKDIQDACDILLPVFESSDGQDGVVSLEVSPLLAHDTEKTISEARRLHGLVDRQNVMIKIPGTPEGVPAIEQVLYEGINVNVTLLFSLQAYRDVMEAYLRAMERRVAARKPVHDILSVASFFVSRVDNEVDSRLQAIIEADDNHDRTMTARALLGRIAVANARLAYQEFKEIFNSLRFGELAGHGVRIQRPLWASTSTKDPSYSDTLYVDELIGPNTVQTLAPASIDAFRDHGTVELTVEKDVDVARDAISEMESLGIAYDDVIGLLISEGVEKFADSFRSLSESVASKSAQIATEERARQREALGGVGEAFDATLASLENDGVIEALQDGDGSFWSDDARTAKEIDGLLGWLQSVPDMSRMAYDGVFAALASEVERRAYDRLILIGMGGSSLAPEVMAAQLSARRGYPKLTVLDSTHPDAVKRAADRLDDERTLFVVSSKSGTTIETLSLCDFFLERNAGNADDFIFITDPGTPLEARARKIRAWKVYTNRHDIGGRFSALSYFGLVPAAAAGLDVGALLGDAAAVLPVQNADHPGIVLGAAIAAAAQQGRNKLTLVASPEWEPFGAWLEQLIAESTGKGGGGIIPIVGETIGVAESGSDDRIFAVIDDGGPAVERWSKTLTSAGQPFLTLPSNLGQLFMIWEIATAVAGRALSINPFDQPNVQEAKDQTNRVLAGEQTDSVAVSNLESAIETSLSQARAGDYVVIQAFVDPSPEMLEALSNLRESLARTTPAPVMVGIGPRFLHSTGQLHKGGPETGVFIQLIQPPGGELNIPGRSYDFGRLIQAQADGDYLALSKRGLRIVRATVASADDVLRMASRATDAGVAAN